jgi:hypothetical protein
MGFCRIGLLRIKFHERHGPASAQRCGFDDPKTMGLTRSVVAKHCLTDTVARRVLQPPIDLSELSIASDRKCQQLLGMRRYDTEVHCLEGLSEEHAVARRVRFNRYWCIFFLLKTRSVYREAFAEELNDNLATEHLSDTARTEFGVLDGVANVQSHCH